MRRMLVPLLLLAAPATAQDGCTQDDPCEWVVYLDEDGFAANTVGGTYFNGTVGDWYRFDFFNGDEASHQVEVEGYGLSWTIDGVDQATTDPFELATEGAFDVTDEPSGDSAVLNVLLGDVVDQEDRQGEQRDTPGPGGLAAIVLAAWIARRR